MDTPKPNEQTLVEVQAWDADHVRTTTRGRWGSADEVRVGTGGSVERNLEVGVWLPFGDAWDLYAPYAGSDSPAQRRRVRLCSAR